MQRLASNMNRAIADARLLLLAVSEAIVGLVLAPTERLGVTSAAT